jgi:hypothetical protein
MFNYHFLRTIGSVQGAALLVAELHGTATTAGQDNSEDQGKQSELTHDAPLKVRVYFFAPKIGHLRIILLYIK